MSASGITHWRCVLFSLIFNRQSAGCLQCVIGHTDDSLLLSKCQCQHTVIWTVVSVGAAPTLTGGARPVPVTGTGLGMLKSLFFFLDAGK